MRRAWWRPALCLWAAATAVLASGCAGSAPAATPAQRESAAANRLQGVIPGQGSVEPSFTLTTTDGQVYPLRRATAGRVVLLYFGYTHCPDQCPTTMADIAAALRHLPARVTSKVAVVFVTTDPRRDTATALRAWLDRFSPAFVGLDGTPAQIGAAELQTGVPAAAPTADRSAPGGYAVNHFAAVLAYWPDGHLAALYPSGSGIGVQTYVHDLPILAGT